MAVALTLMIYPLVEWPTIDPISAGLSEIINQILIGALMGFFLQIVTAAVVVGGPTVAILWAYRWRLWWILVAQSHWYHSF